MRSRPSSCRTHDPAREVDRSSSPCSTIGTPFTIVACTPLPHALKRPTPPGRSCTNSFFHGPIVSGSNTMRSAGRAGPEHAPVAEPDQRRRHLGDLADALLERPHLAVEHPRAQEVRAPVGAVVAREVRAAVGDADHHPRVELRLADRLRPLGALRPPAELRGEILGEREVEHRVGGRDAELVGDLADRTRPGTSRARAARTSSTNTAFQSGGGTVVPCAGSRL